MTEIGFHLATLLAWSLFLDRALTALTGIHRELIPSLFFLLQQDQFILSLSQGPWKATQLKKC
jgi:hypothetical protein